MGKRNKKKSTETSSKGHPSVETQPTPSSVHVVACPCAHLRVTVTADDGTLFQGTIARANANVDVSKGVANDGNTNAECTSRSVAALELELQRLRESMATSSVGIPSPPVSRSETLGRQPSVSVAADFVAWEGRPSIYPHVPQAHRDVLEQLLAESDDPVETLRRSEFDGFLNLGIILLVFSLAYITFKNVQRNGLLVDASAFSCPLAVYYRDFGILATTFAASFAVAMIQFASTKLWAIRRIRSRAYATCYCICQGVLQIVGTTGLFMSNGGPIVSGMSYMVLACFGLKMHSFYATNRLMNAENQARGKSSGTSDDGSITATLQLPPHVTPPPRNEPTVAAPFRFPANLTISSTLYYYICTPVLVYEPSYPHTRKIRVGYVMWKLAQLSLDAGVIYVLFLQFILPVIHNQESFVVDLVKMVVPSFIAWLCMFHAMFQVRSMDVCLVLSPWFLTFNVGYAVRS